MMEIDIDDNVSFDEDHGLKNVLSGAEQTEIAIDLNQRMDDYYVKQRNYSAPCHAF